MKGEPESVYESLKENTWKEAMNKEINQLQRMTPGFWSYHLNHAN